MTETWRVALASGEVREVVVEYNGVQWRTFVDDYFGWGRAPQSAVAAVVGMHGWPVAEILAPGEPTRAELIAERDAAHAALTEARRVLHFAERVAAAWTGAHVRDDAVSEAVGQRIDEAGDWTLAGPLTALDALSAERDAARSERDAARCEGAEAMREAILAALHQSLSGDQLRAIRAVEIDGGAR